MIVSTFFYFLFTSRPTRNGAAWAIFLTYDLGVRPFQSNFLQTLTLEKKFFDAFNLVYPAGRLFFPYQEEYMEYEQQSFPLPLVAQHEAKKHPIARKDFDADRAEQHKVSGMAAAANKRETALALAKTLAVEIAIEKGTCTADDVQAALIAKGYDSSDLGAAAGSLFKGKRWEWTGEWVPSQRVSNHKRMLRVWRLR